MAGKIYGTAGNDILTVRNFLSVFGGADVYAGGGHDWINDFDSSDNWIYGEAGNDTIIAGGGVNLYDGGGGVDMVSYQNIQSGVFVDLQGEIANKGGETDRLVSIENVIGTDYADTLIGNSSSNYLAGGDGNDTLSGGLGNDSLWGGTGNDTLDGGHGADFLHGGSGWDKASYRSSSTAVFIDLANTAANSGDARGDVYTEIEAFELTDQADGFLGSALGEFVNGGKGNDYIDGRTGRDLIYGGDGNDTIIGGMGKDVLRGEAGADTFRFNSTLESTVIPTYTADGLNSGFDMITDFRRGVDKIDVSNIDANINTAINDAFRQTSGNFTAAGQFRVSYNAQDNVTSVQFNTDSNFSTAEMTIELYGNIAVNSSDFLL